MPASSKIELPDKPGPPPTATVSSCRYLPKRDLTPVLGQQSPELLIRGTHSCSTRVGRKKATCPHISTHFAYNRKDLSATMFERHKRRNALHCLAHIKRICVFDISRNWPSLGSTRLLFFIGRCASFPPPRLNTLWQPFTASANSYLPTEVLEVLFDFVFSIIFWFWL